MAAITTAVASSASMAAVAQAATSVRETPIARAPIARPLTHLHHTPDPLMKKECRGKKGRIETEAVHFEVMV